MAHSANFKAELVIKPGELGSGEIFVECKIQEISRNCFVDTGSNLTFVNLDSFTESFPRIGEVKKSGASGSSISGDKVQVNSFQIGKTELGPKSIGRFKGTRHDLIGMDLFSSGTLEFDFQSNQLVFVEDSVDLPENFEQLEKGHISLPIKFGSILDLRIIFDTGAGLNSVDQKFVDTHAEFFQYLQEVEAGYDINGHQVIMKLYKANDFKIGQVQFKNQNFLAFDFGKLRDYLGLKTPFVLGFNSLEKTKWKFNLHTKKFAVEKAD